MTDLTKAAQAALDALERNECEHMETHRGGVIWTICDSCGRKWADDEGGVPPYVEPAHITNLRAALAAQQCSSFCHPDEPCSITESGKCDVKEQAAQPVAWCALTPAGQIAYFDGKPMVMVGPKGNDMHPYALYAAEI